MNVSDAMTQNVLTIEPRADARLAIQMMLWGGFRHLPVVRDGDVVGILSEHDLCRVGGASGARVEELMTTEVATTTPGESLADAAASMAAARIGCMPVVDDGALAGLLTTTDVLAHMVGEVPRLPVNGEARVRDLMSTTPRAVLVGSRLQDAIGEMMHRDVRHMPVVNVNDHVIGMLSDRDVRTLVGDPIAALRGEGFNETLALPVEEVMTNNPITVREDSPLSALANVLLEDRVGAVPVVSADGRLVGVVSYIDVVHYALRGTNRAIE